MIKEPTIKDHPDGKHYYVDYGNGVVTGPLTMSNCRDLILDWKQQQKALHIATRDRFLRRAIGEGAP